MLDEQQKVLQQMAAHGSQLELKPTQLARSAKESSSTQQQQTTTIVNVVQELQKSVSETGEKIVLLEANTQQAAAALSTAATATRGVAKSSVAPVEGAATKDSMVDT